MGVETAGIALAEMFAAAEAAGAIGSAAAGMASVGGGLAAAGGIGAGLAASEALAGAGALGEVATAFPVLAAEGITELGALGGAEAGMWGAGELAGWGGLEGAATAGTAAPWGASELAGWGGLEGAALDSGVALGGEAGLTAASASALANLTPGEIAALEAAAMAAPGAGSGGGLLSTLGGKLMGISPVQALQIGSGVYGIAQGQAMGEQAKKAYEQQQAMRGPAAAALNSQIQAGQLLKMPTAENLTSLPGYQSGLEAVQRSLAAQGYQGSGNMMAALQNYGGQFYQNALQNYNQQQSNLMQMAGAGQSSGLPQQMTQAGTMMTGQGLGALGQVAAMDQYGNRRYQ